MATMRALPHQIYNSNHSRSVKNRPPCLLVRQATSAAFIYAYRPK